MPLLEMTEFTIANAPHEGEATEGYQGEDSLDR